VYKLGLYTLPRIKFYNLTIITMGRKREFTRTEIKWNVYWKLQATWNYYRKNSRLKEEVVCLKCGWVHYVDRCCLITNRCWCRKCSHLKHWLADTRFYQVWKNINQRCKNPRFKDYHWKWIKVKWNSFDEFKTDMYESYVAHVEQYWEKETTIDRIDVNWNYCKENCRWATYKEQWNNQRKTVWIKRTSEELWLPIWTVNYWYYSKWLTLEQIQKKFSN
jgi:hypothetical protein